MDPDKAVWTPPANLYRLPRNILPKEYFLSLAPNLKDHTFSGAIYLILDAKNPTSEIVMNALDLNISEYRLTRDGRDIPITEMSFDKEKEMVTFKLGETISAKPGTPIIFCADFKGELNDKMHGFYRMHDKDKNVIGAATQFEAIDARRCFPCFDEPDMKAVFNVTLDVPENMAALSNMPVKYAGQPNHGRKQIVFRPTPPMSTYLAAFVVAELEYIEGRDRKGIPIRVLCCKTLRQCMIWTKRIRTRLKLTSKILRRSAKSSTLPHTPAAQRCAAW